MTGAPVNRHRFIKLTDATKSVDRGLEAKARGLAGLKGYTTNLVEASTFVLGCLEPDGMRESRNFVSEMARRYDGHS